jgi:hypothetical protein
MQECCALKPLSARARVCDTVCVCAFVCVDGCLCLCVRVCGWVGGCSGAFVYVGVIYLVYTRYNTYLNRNVTGTEIDLKVLSGNKADLRPTFSYARYMTYIYQVYVMHTHGRFYVCSCKIIIIAMVCG